jgi:hypothetical protein
MNRSDRGSAPIFFPAVCSPDTHISGDANDEDSDESRLRGQWYGEPSSASVPSPCVENFGQATPRWSSDSPSRPPIATEHHDPSQSTYFYAVRSIDGGRRGHFAIGALLIGVGGGMMGATYAAAMAHGRAVMWLLAGAAIGYGAVRIFRGLTSATP